MWKGSNRIGKAKALILFHWFHEREGQLVTYPEIKLKMETSGLSVTSQKVLHHNIQALRRWYPEYVFASAYDIGYVMVRRPDGIAQPRSQR